MQKSPIEIGPYQVIKSLGKGGMGEVFLVNDSKCQRQIALKKILPELASHDVIKQRFLREARCAAQLSHPCIIPIFSIDTEEIYYTMPYIEGETLKEIFKATLEKEKMGLSPHELGVSIPALTRVFLSVCQAMASASAKGFLHRDLKPENIMVGKYGEVFLLDWGIAAQYDVQELEEIHLPSAEDNLTRPGKVLGTVNFMSPERALKSPASLQSEIYSLGVILYLILTLKYPFVRKNLQHFRKIMKFENLTPPEELAPYRDIPKQLSLIAQKCLQKNPKDRYQTLQELIFDLENYIQGRPEWIFSGSLQMMRKEDWEFQENILLSPQMAISSLLDSLEWVGLMLSKKSFSGNFKLEFELMLPEGHEGIGILMCVPEPSDRKGLEDGYCLWISNPTEQRLLLYRSNAEILSISQSGVIKNQKTAICIEKIDHSLMVYISGVLKLHYTSHIPLVGTHLGLLYKNPDFQLSALSISSGSHAVMINCLSVPDAFFSQKNFDQAYLDYKKISSSFEGRSEGREAQFRAGLSLLEKGKREKSKHEKEDLFSKATQEFEKLRGGLGAPLEYLGKSLIYYYEGDYEEEIKCFELVLRKFPHNPLLAIIKEQIIIRLHETSKHNKEAAYRFTLLCLMHLQDIFSIASNAALLENLIKHRPNIFFFDLSSHSPSNPDYLSRIALQIAFLLNKPLFILEIYETLSKDYFSLDLFKEVVLALLCLQKEPLLDNFLKEHHQIINLESTALFLADTLMVYLNTLSAKKALENLMAHEPTLESFSTQLFFVLALNCLYETNLHQLLSFIKQIEKILTCKEEIRLINQIKIQALLLLKEVYQANKIFDSISEQDIKDGNSPFNFLYFCTQALTQEFQDINRLQGNFHLHFDKNSQKAFFWEKWLKLEKLLFFYTLSKDTEKLAETNKRLHQLRLHQSHIDN